MYPVTSIGFNHLDTLFGRISFSAVKLGGTDGESLKKWPVGQQLGDFFH